MLRMLSVFLLNICAIILCIGLLIPASGEEYGVVGQPLSVKSSTLWGERSIPICWEVTNPTYAAERGWVQDAVAKTWQKESTLVFTGWGTCADDNPGIRIRMADERPHVVALGSELDGVVSWMVLNFAYGSDGQARDNGGDVIQGYGEPGSIPAGAEREFCIRSTAAPEALVFGIVGWKSWWWGIGQRGRLEQFLLQAFRVETRSDWPTPRWPLPNWPAVAGCLSSESDRWVRRTRDPKRGSLISH